jgi:hypothetical protein
MHKQMWTDVIAYIKQWHTTGVAWNPQVYISSGLLTPHSHRR